MRTIAAVTLMLLLAACGRGVDTEKLVNERNQLEAELAQMQIAGHPKPPLHLGSQEPGEIAADDDALRKWRAEDQAEKARRAQIKDRLSEIAKTLNKG